jgi:molybdopterin-guanine dinucleotide biosynthesis protein A
MTPPPAGLILAGGQSRRFGSDKAVHAVAGSPMVARVYAAVAGVADPVLISFRSRPTAPPPRLKSGMNPTLTVNGPRGASAAGLTPVCCNSPTTP